MTTHADSGAARDVAQKTYELGHPSAYMKIRMTLAGEDSRMDACTDAATVEGAVRVALARAHGAVGGAKTFEVCGARAEDGTCVLRVDECDVKALWSALTMVDEINDRACIFEILAIEASLVRLAGGM